MTNDEAGVPEDVRELARMFAPDLPDYAATSDEVRAAIANAIMLDRSRRPAPAEAEAGVREAPSLFT